MCKFPPHFHYAGGERSFTTVALTLAIGEWANCPFRALDEFDVFADSVTRTVSLASLFGFARHCHELQVDALSVTFFLQLVLLFLQLVACRIVALHRH